MVVESGPKSAGQQFQILAFPLQVAYLESHMTYPRLSFLICKLEKIFHTVAVGFKCNPVHKSLNCKSVHRFERLLYYF
jgi:hypothetical protein